jgi:hypothetical protein
VTRVLRRPGMIIDVSLRLLYLIFDRPTEPCSPR